jgi:U32 family peptidase
MGIKDMHAAVLVSSDREFGVFSVAQEKLFTTVKAAGTFIKAAQEASAYTVFRNHHFYSALTDDTVRKQIDRLGTTEYCLNSLTFEHDENVMVPMSEMNEARRKAAEMLDAARLEAFAPARTQRHQFSEKLVPEAKGSRSKHSLLTVHCDTVAKAEVALNAGADRILFGGDSFSSKFISEDDYRQVAELARKAGKEFAFATPRIVKENQLQYFNKLFAVWNELRPDYVYINNNGLWLLASKYENTSDYLDHAGWNQAFP